MTSFITSVFTRRNSRPNQAMSAKVAQQRKAEAQAEFNHFKIAICDYVQLCADHAPQIIQPMVTSAINTIKKAHSVNLVKQAIDDLRNQLVKHKPANTNEFCEKLSSLSDNISASFVDTNLHLCLPDKKQIDDMLATIEIRIKNSLGKLDAYSKSIVGFDAVLRDWRRNIQQIKINKKPLENFSIPENYDFKNYVGLVNLLDEKACLNPPQAPIKSDEPKKESDLPLQPRVIAALLTQDSLLGASLPIFQDLSINGLSCNWLDCEITTDKNSIVIVSNHDLKLFGSNSIVSLATFSIEYQLHWKFIQLIYLDSIKISNFKNIAPVNENNAVFSYVNLYRDLCNAHFTDKIDNDSYLLETVIAKLPSVVKTRQYLEAAQDDYKTIKTTQLSSNLNKKTKALTAEQAIYEKTHQLISELIINIRSCSVNQQRIKVVENFRQRILPFFSEHNIIKSFADDLSFLRTNLIQMNMQMKKNCGIFVNDLIDLEYHFSLTPFPVNEIVKKTYEVLAEAYKEANKQLNVIKPHYFTATNVAEISACLVKIFNVEIFKHVKRDFISLDDARVHINGRDNDFGTQIQITLNCHYKTEGNASLRLGTLQYSFSVDRVGTEINSMLPIIEAMSISIEPNKDLALYQHVVSSTLNNILPTCSELERSCKEFAYSIEQLEKLYFDEKATKHKLLCEDRQLFSNDAYLSTIKTINLNEQNSSCISELLSEYNLFLEALGLDNTLSHEYKLNSYHQQQDFAHEKLTQLYKYRSENNRELCVNKFEAYCHHRVQVLRDIFVTLIARHHEKQENKVTNQNNKISLTVYKKNPAQLIINSLVALAEAATPDSEPIQVLIPADYPENSLIALIKTLSLDSHLQYVTNNNYHSAYKKMIKAFMRKLTLHYQPNNYSLATVKTIAKLLPEYCTLSIPITTEPRKLFATAENLALCTNLSLKADPKFEPQKEYLILDVAQRIPAFSDFFVPDTVSPVILSECKKSATKKNVTVTTMAQG